MEIVPQLVQVSAPNASVEGSNQAGSITDRNTGHTIITNTATVTRVILAPMGKSIQLARISLQDLMRLIQQIVSILMWLATVVL